VVIKGKEDAIDSQGDAVERLTKDQRKIVARHAQPIAQVLGTLHSSSLRDDVESGD
jgi:hypothetical protein